MAMVELWDWIGYVLGIFGIAVADEFKSRVGILEN